MNTCTMTSRQLKKFTQAAIEFFGDTIPYNFKETAPEWTEVTWSTDKAHYFVHGFNAGWFSKGVFDK